MPNILYGRWNPTEVRTKIVDDTWTTVETVTGMEKITPSSIIYSGTNASIELGGKVTFNRVTSITFNDIFSSAYRNYRIYFGISSFLWDTTFLRARLMTNATTEVATNYLYGQARATSATLDISNSTSGQTSWTFAHISTELLDGEVDIISPFLTVDKSFYKKGIRDDEPRDDSTYSLEDYFGYVTSSLSCTGLKLLPQNSADYISGYVHVYGFK